MEEKRIDSRKKSKIVRCVVLGSIACLSLSFCLMGPMGSGKMALAASSEAVLEKLREAAYKEGELMWYESSPDNAIAKIAAAFSKRYPKIRLEQTRLRGAEVGTRIIAESQANAPTGDVGTTGLEVLWALEERGLLMKPNWAEMGIASTLVAAPYALKTMASSYCLIYNTKLVSEADAPKSWEDMLNPKWKGKVGIWQKSSALALLASVWGEARIIDFAKKLAAQKPVVYQSSYPLNDAVAAGEIALGITTYHTAPAAIEKKAPLKLVFVDPIPYEPICSSIPVKSPHPNAGKLFALWLLSREGAEAYERATYRGNPWIEGTETYRLLSGKKLSTFTPQQNKEFADISKKLDDILVGL
jgi:iron(III) transport system substrate-binding protein